MQMTQTEYDELMAHFYFLGDKIDPVYKREAQILSFFCFDSVDEKTLC